MTSAHLKESGDTPLAGIISVLNATVSQLEAASRVESGPVEAEIKKLEVYKL
jgi:hypothetical protein